MSRPYALLRAGFPYVKSLGMRRVTNDPIDIALGEGMYYVLNRTGIIARLQWDDDGSWDVGDLKPIAGAGQTDGKFDWPVSILMDNQKTLWVSDEGKHSISNISVEGEFISKWGEHGSGDGQLDGPSGMAFDAEENFYVSDTRNHRIQKFTKDGKFILKWGEFGGNDGEFNMPWGLTVDELGDVYVADWRNDRIQKFSPEGEFICSLGKSGNSDGEFCRPTGVAVDAHGDIYVADAGNDRVQLFAEDGRYVEKFIGDASLSKMARDYMLTNAGPLRQREMAKLEPQKRFRTPRSVKLDDQFRMFVTDMRSMRVQVYQKDAEPLTPDLILSPPKSPSLVTN